MYKTYINPDGLKITLPADVWEYIMAEVSRHYPNECGGVFTGRIDIASNNAIIEQALKPSKTISTPIFFRRFANGINKLLLQVFKKTNGESYYLGEWHSHPNGKPYPSQTDFSTMNKIANNENL